MDAILKMDKEMEDLESEHKSALSVSSDEAEDTSTPSSFHDDKNHRKPQEFKMAESETNRIRILRPLLIITTLIIGAAVTTLTFIWLKNDYAKKGQNSVRTEYTENREILELPVVLEKLPLK